MQSGKMCSSIFSKVLVNCNMHLILCRMIRFGLIKLYSVVQHAHVAHFTAAHLPEQGCLQDICTLIGKQ